MTWSKCRRNPTVASSSGMAAIIPLARLFVLMLSTSSGMAACLLDSSRDLPALTVEENKARREFLTDVCRESVEDLYEATGDPRLKNRFTNPSLSPFNLTDIYPTTARREHREGLTRLAFIVDADGNVSNVTVISSSGYRDLDDAAAIHFAGTHFASAAKIDGRSVAVILYVPVRFKIAAR